MQMWLSNPQPTNLSPMDMMYQHERDMMLGLYNVRGRYFYPQSPYGMSGLGCSAGEISTLQGCMNPCAPPFFAVPTVTSNLQDGYTCACPPSLFTLNDPTNGRQCVASCPTGTIPNPYGTGVPGQSQACVADPNYVPPGDQINLQTGAITPVGTPHNLTPSAAPTQAPASQPGVVPVAMTPKPPVIPSPAPVGSGQQQQQQTGSGAQTGKTILGMPQDTFFLVAAGAAALIFFGMKK